MAIHEEAVREQLGAIDAVRVQEALMALTLHLARGGSVGGLIPAVANQVLLNPTTLPVAKRLAYSVIRHAPLKHDEWELVSASLRQDLTASPEQCQLALSSISALPLFAVKALVDDHSREISLCLTHSSGMVRAAAAEVVGYLLACDSTLRHLSSTYQLQQATKMWVDRVAQLFTDAVPEASEAAFQAASCTFRCTEGEPALMKFDAIHALDDLEMLPLREEAIIMWCEYLTLHRLPVLAHLQKSSADVQLAAVFPVAMAARTEAAGGLHVLRSHFHARVATIWTPAGLKTPSHELDQQGGVEERLQSQYVSPPSQAPGLVAASFLPLLSCLDPPLVFEVSVQVLLLVEAGAPQSMARAACAALLGLWENDTCAHAGRDQLMCTLVQGSLLVGLEHMSELLRALISKLPQVLLPDARRRCTALLAAAVLTFEFLSKRLAKVEAAAPQAASADTTRLGCVLESALSSNYPSPCQEEMLACLLELHLAVSNEYHSVSGATLSDGPARTRTWWNLLWAEIGVELAELGSSCLEWDSVTKGEVYVADAYLRLVTHLCSFSSRSARAQGVVGPGLHSVTGLCGGASLYPLLVKFLHDAARLATPVLRRRMAWLLVHNLPLDGADSEAVGAVVERLVGAVSACLEDVYRCKELAVQQSRHALREGFLMEAAPAGEAAGQGEAAEVVMACALHLARRHATAASLLAAQFQGVAPVTVIEGGSSTPARVVTEQWRRTLQQLQLCAEPQSRSNQISCELGMGEAYPLSHLHPAERVTSQEAASDMQASVVNAVATCHLPGCVLPTPPFQAGYDELSDARAIEQVLSGSSDGMYIKGRVRVDALVRRLTLQLEICNLMEVKLPPGGMVRLGTSNGLSLESNAHGPLLALPQMGPEEKTTHEVDYRVHAFSRCVFHVQLVLPSSTHMTSDDEGGTSMFEEEAKPFIQMTHRCLPLHVPLVRLLQPSPMLKTLFFQEWTSLQFCSEMIVDFQSSAPIGTKVTPISTRAFSRVHQQALPACGSLQECFSASTWFQERVLLIVFTHAELGSNHSNTWQKMIVKTSAACVLDTIAGDKRRWVEDLTCGLGVLAEGDGDWTPGIISL